MHKYILFLIVIAVLIVGAANPAKEPAPKASPTAEDVQMCHEVGRMHMRRCAQVTSLTVPGFDPTKSDPKTQYLIGTCSTGGVAAMAWCLEDRPQTYSDKYKDECLAGRNWHHDIFAESRRRFETTTGNQSGREESLAVEELYLKLWDRACARYQAEGEVQKAQPPRPPMGVAPKSLDL
jgi:hypothetical protein